MNRVFVLLRGHLFSRKSLLENRTHRMKICFVAELYPPNLGGVEFALSKIVEGLVAEGIEVTVITSRFDRRLPRREQKPGYTIIRVPVFPFLKRFWFLLFSLPIVFHHARRCDLIQGSTFAGAVPASLVGLLLRKKRVLLVHEIMAKQWFKHEPNPLKSTFYWITERIIARLPFHRYVAVSNYTKSTLISDGVRADRIDVIYHGDSRLENATLTEAAARAQLGFLPSQYLYLTFGRAGVSKGIEYLVEAIPEIVRQIPSARFLLILSKYDRRVWEKIVRGLSQMPDELYRLFPPVPREILASYVSAANCVVIPSLSEGFGFSALEACNAGKVVVATDAGSLPEVVHGRYVFVQPGSSKALVEGCLRAYEGKVDNREPRGFNWTAAIAKYKELYGQLLETQEK